MRKEFKISMSNNSALERIEWLVAYLNERTKEYDEGQPTISDQDWDTFYFELRDLEQATGTILENSPTQKVIYSVVNALEKSEHNHKMLSLEKTKDIEEVRAFVGDNEFLAMCKMDGLTCSLRYVNGSLVSAETRGDGLVGENILHNAMVIPSIPKKIPYYDELIVDGEIICVHSDFEEFAEEYKNSRNFASGSIRLLDSEECAKRHLTFVAWDVIKGLEPIPTLSNRLALLQSEFYFTTVPGIIGDKDYIAECIEAIKHKAVQKGFPIDGVVFKFNDVAYGRSQGETAHHFKNALAFKFYDETYSTHMKNIEWTMGRTGVLTPVAVFGPIDIDGSTVERASLHNVSVMFDTLGGGSWVGQEVQVYKANMIIPQIKSAENIMPEGADLINIPHICPVCGGETKIVKSIDGIETLICTNPDCEGKLINKLDHFCGKKGLDIKGLSKATLEKLIDWGWLNSYRDLFYLFQHTQEWVQKPGFGQKSVNKICEAIDESRKCELWQFISALGIPLIGSTYAKQMAKIEKGWIQIREDIEAKYDFSKWDGFGPEMTASLWIFDYREADWLVEYVMELKNSLWIDPTAEVEKKSLDGITVVITGKLNQYKNRDALKEAIEAAGGKVAGSVSKNTNYLINNDATSSSSKNVTAQKLGVEIITESDFMKKFFD